MGTTTENERDRSLVKGFDFVSLNMIEKEAENTTKKYKYFRIVRDAYIFVKNFSGILQDCSKKK